MSNNSDEPRIVLPDPVPDESEMVNGLDRRRVPRFPFTAEAQVTELYSKTSVAGRSSDLGLGGCYIDIISPFAVGSVVGVRLEHDRHAFEAIAQVTYAKMSMGMGLAFTEIKPEDQAVLQAWVAELSGERLPEPDRATAGPESDLVAGVLNLQQVLNELINLMVRNKSISESEASALLRNFSH